MTRKVVPFKRWHLDWLGEAAEPGPFSLSDAVLRQLESANSWTGMVDGEVVACAGTIAQWPTRHIAWALLGRNSAAHMLWITRCVRKNLKHVKGRIEMTVRADFPQGQHWAEILGFHVETPEMPMYGPEGETHVGYVRVN